ncbi:hypothetical protein [Streptomyces sp. NPDC058193]|uniref:hypothetical protein n=1 Tax=Streptomyces sp. NPDC058193 TaxID=3346373 RepID=UPI0036E663DE
MGLSYSYEIITPARDVGTALRKLRELAPRPDRRPPITVTLPGGDRVVVPYTSGFRSEPVDCSAGGTLELDTSLMFGVDDAVREYMEDRDPEADELGRVPIGYIYLTVRFAPAEHPRYASLEFMAATSAMSRLFARSPGVRAVFTGLAAESGGACCLFDTETEILDVCWLDGRPVQETVPGPRFANYRALAATWSGQGPVAKP